MNVENHSNDSLKRIFELEHELYKAKEEIGRLRHKCNERKKEIILLKKEIIKINDSMADMNEGGDSKLITVGLFD